MRNGGRMKIQPLLSHPPLEPGESLPSLLARIAKSNNYEPRSILFTVIRDVAKVEYIHRLSRLSQVSQFECLGALTKVTPYELYKSTDHHFAHILTPPEHKIEYIELTPSLSVPLLPNGTARKQIRSEYASQFCPLCLKAAAYHRLIWLPIASAICLEHKCLLVTSCPKCGKQTRIQDIIEVCCSGCRTDLTEIQAISLENDWFGFLTQSLIQSWLMGVFSPISISNHLPQQMPRDLYRVIEGLRLSIIQVTQDWPLLHQVNTQQHTLRLLPDTKAATLTPYQSYCLYATACKGIIDWPNGFYQFLTAYRDIEGRREVRKPPIHNGIGDKLGDLYLYWLNKRWKQPTLDFVQEAFHQYLLNHQTTFPSITLLTRYKEVQQLNQNFGYMSLSKAAALLSVSPDKLRPMIKSGSLKTYSKKDKGSILLIRREDVMELSEKWKQGLNLKEVMEWLGLSDVVVVKLVQAGLLDVSPRTSQDASWIFSPLAVTEFQERVLGRVYSNTVEKNGYKEAMLTLRQASILLKSRLGAGLGEIVFVLREVAEGRLRAYLPQDQTHSLRTLLFSRTDVDQYVEAVKAEKRWIGRKEVASIFKIHAATVQDWIKAGLISPVISGSHEHYFDRQIIENLKSDLVRNTEASEILGVHTQAVNALVRQGRIEAIRGPGIDGYPHYIFSRKSLLKWRNARLPLREVSQLLHIDERQIVIWVRQGKMPPPEDDQQKPLFFSRQSLNKYGLGEPEQAASFTNTFEISQAR